MSERRNSFDVFESASAAPGSSATTSAGRNSSFSHPRRKIPPKFYRMGEVVEYSGVSRQTIHNYTTMGLLRETHWTAGGHRLYDESVFERLSEILRLRKTKTLSQIREILRKKERRDIQSQSTGDDRV